MTVQMKLKPKLFFTSECYRVVEICMHVLNILSIAFKKIKKFYDLLHCTKEEKERDIKRKRERKFPAQCIKSKPYTGLCSLFKAN